MIPSSDDAPGYWMNETSGVLRPAIEAYLARAINPEAPAMTAAHIAIMRAYLKQWIDCPLWLGPLIDPLRTQVRDIANETDIARWLDRAMDANIDPL